MNTLKNLKWGVAISATQTEGAFDKDGKGVSIWDEFTKKSRRIKDGTDTAVGTGFYDRYIEDIDIAVDIGLHIFRFSIAWTRILPDGTGEVNQRGIDFYNNVIDYCILKGIDPWITTYHWDLPQKLQEIGGWTNRTVIDHYESYVTILRDQFSDRVKHWILINEGVVCMGAGYFLGIHAPGKRGVRNFIASTHHILLAQARGYKILKTKKNVAVGTALSCTTIEPFSDSLSDKTTARRIDALMNRLYIEPHLGLGYPIRDLPFLKRIKKYVKEGDMEALQTDFDFWGIQTYAREVVKSAWYVPYLKAITIRPKNRGVETSAMGWETYSIGTQLFLERFARYDANKPLWLSECGMVLSAGDDEKKRITYYEEVIQAMKYVLDKGIPLKGILIWTLVDNFEWAEGYVPKFGIVKLDRKTLERSLKKSAFWLKDYLRNR